MEGALSRLPSQAKRHPLPSLRIPILYLRVGMLGQMRNNLPGNPVRRRHVLRWAGLLLFAAFFCTASATATAPDPRPVVKIDTGLLAGTNSGSINVFKGIPYAAPPTGVLRWRPPATAASWSGTRDASVFGAICPQPVREGVGMPRANRQPQSEDCLFLNVWSFVGARKAPVMVWIHGGGFRFGASSLRYYDGSDFAKDGVILVSLNYRLGALGFFAYPALAQDADSGNYGIMDQIAALQWVRRNISAFGGDPGNVTVAGESAGGKSVLTLLTIPAAKGLFSKAIVESGGGWERQHTLQEQEKNDTALISAAGLGADASPAQLRALPPEKLFGEPTALGDVGPFQDGRLVTESVTQAFLGGRQMHVPLLIGSNSYEASLMNPFGESTASVLARAPNSVKALYPGDDKQKAAAIFTDSVMGAPAHWVAVQASKAAPTYLYHFSYVPTVRREAAPGAPHGGEIPFVFGSWPQAFDRFASPDDRAMEARMHACWVAFVKTGAPACGDIAWPAYAPADDALMEFDSTSGMRAHFRKAQYDALEQALQHPASEAP